MPSMPSMEEKLTPFSHAVVIISYLTRTLGEAAISDPSAAIEDVVLESPYFPLARAILLETYFARIDKPLLFGKSRLSENFA